MVEPRKDRGELRACRTYEEVLKHKWIRVILGRTNYDIENDGIGYWNTERVISSDFTW